MAEDLIRWNRFWCPIGAPTNLGDNGLGFLADPEGQMGKLWSPNTFSLKELLRLPCIVLCGEPGIGKTSTLELGREDFKQSAGGNNNLLWISFTDTPDLRTFENRVFGSEQWAALLSSSDRTITLVIDGLDEALIRIPRFLEYLIGKFSGVDRSRLHLRIVCRVAEWPKTEGDKLLALWPSDEQTPLIYELCPLRQRDAFDAATFWGASGEQFIEAVYERHIVPLAAHPVTLRFLVREFASGKALGITRSEIYSVGCTRLCGEPDPGRTAALRASNVTTIGSNVVKIREAAAKICGLLILCGKSGVFLGHAESCPNSLVPVDEICNLVAIEGDANFPKAALATALFRALGPNTLGFAHQTFAEFLAAEFLRSMALPQIRRLLCNRDAGREYIIPQLSEVAAWLTVNDPDFLQWAVENEPETLLRTDASRINAAIKEKLVKCLLDRAKAEDLFDDRNTRRFYSSLKHPGIVSQVRPYITDRSLNIVVRRMAVDIARACRLSELTDDFVNIVQNEQAEGIRNTAIYALEDVIPQNRVNELIPFARGEAGPDPDDNLRGCALRRLVPSVWSVANACEAIVPPNDSHHFGSYFNTLNYDFPKHITATDVPFVFRRLAELDDDDESGFFTALTDAALLVGARAIDVPEVACAIADFIAPEIGLPNRCLNYPSNALRKAFDDDDDLRLKFAETMLLKNELSVDRISQLIIVDGLYLKPEDLRWLLDKISDVPQPRRNAWAEAVQMYARTPQLHHEWDLFLTRLTEVPELAELFAWLRAWDLNEEIALTNRGRWLQEQELTKRFQRPPAVPRAERVRVALEAIASGEISRWVDVSWNLWIDEEGRAFMTGGLNIKESAGWKETSIERQLAIRAAAQRFLLHAPPLERNRRNNYSVTWAVFLLRAELQNNRTLAEAVRARWASTALQGPALGHSDQQQELVSFILAFAPNETIGYLFDELNRQNEAGGDLLSLHMFRTCWNATLSERLVAWLRSTQLTPKALGYCLKHLSVCDTAVATHETKQLLQSLSQVNNRTLSMAEELVEVAVAFLPDTCWDEAWRLAKAHSDLGRNLVRRLSDDLRSDSRRNIKWTPNQVAELYLLSRRHFPNEAPRRGGTYTTEQSVEDFQRTLLSALVASATPEACRELLRLSNELPAERLWLRWRYAECVRGKHSLDWCPPAIETVAELRARNDARLVEDEDDLLEVVCESLERYQQRISSTINPEGETFWHWQGADTRRKNFRPRDEQFLSNRIAGWLRQDLVDRQVIVGREVQPSVGKKTDIYIATIPEPVNGSSAREVTVVIEVKGCWNPGVLTAAESQLVNDYLKAHNLTHGIYLVGWFVCAVWKKPVNKLKSKSFGHAVNKVRNLVLKYDGKLHSEKVIGIVLDCSYSA